MKTERRLIYADKLQKSIRDDEEISGAMYARVKMHINEAEAVDTVEVVHGRWIGGYYQQDGEWFYKKPVCSECGREHDGGATNYCENCGAKMDGERRTDNERKAD